jgi:hypothetical protein
LRRPRARCGCSERRSASALDDDEFLATLPAAAATVEVAEDKLRETSACFVGGPELDVLAEALRVTRQAVWQRFAPERTPGEWTSSRGTLLARRVGALRSRSRTYPRTTHAARMWPAILATIESMSERRVERS